jgi:hypothetical protein
VQYNGNFRDAVTICKPTSCFYIYYRIHDSKHSHFLMTFFLQKINH